MARTFVFRNNGGMDVNWLKREIEERGISQAEMARVLGIGESAMSKAMNGTRKFSATEADTIRRYLGYRLPGDTPDERRRRIDRVVSGLHVDQERALALYLEALTGKPIEPRTEEPQVN